ncbi:MAG: 1,4-dihydroxy-6-naphthoate synthase, partial [Bacteroidota bacterium]
MKIKLGFSTCPNDTFMFDALVHGRIDTGRFSFDLELADIFHLNQMAIAQTPDLVKVSYSTYFKVQDQYQLLNAGSALGHDCGPLLISKDSYSISDLIEQHLPVAIPGQNTTANLLLSYFAPSLLNRRAYLFHEIMPAILSGEVAAGVIIHENRFTYQQQSLRLIQDLGVHWEKATKLPIPLGAIIAKRSLGFETIDQLEKLMHDSVAYAFAHPEQCMPFVRKHAQEMEDSVMKAHIDLYVNDYSLNLGEQGKAAVDLLMKTRQEMDSY